MQCSVAFGSENTGGSVRGDKVLEDSKKTIGPESRRRQVTPAGPGLSDSEPIAECCALPWPYFFLVAFFLVTFLATFFLATFFLTFLIAGLHPQVLHIVLPFLQFTRFPYARWPGVSAIRRG
jgi:hypothetical protein